MCTTCGCGEGEVKIEGQDPPRPHHPHHTHGHGHDHPHHHDHGSGELLDFGRGPAHAHAPGLTQARTLQIERDILSLNNAHAADNRRYFTEHGVFVVNLVSSPGSGKTTLLARTIERLKARLPMAVIEGDQQTTRDADRIRAIGVPTVQVNTGKGCHLDAHMVGHALEHLAVADDSVLFIENVGNLVCPAAFDLGEAHKVVVLSVTEGDDKPLKYPDMFHAAGLMVLNKIDLLPYVEFDPQQCVHYARRVQPDIQVMEVSATRGEGMESWCAWLERGRNAVAEHRRSTVQALGQRNTELEAEVAALRARLGERG